MSPLLSRIFNQAGITFNAANQRDLQRNLAVLKSLVDSVKYNDLNLDPEIVSKRFFSTPDKAPCTYVSMYEGPTFSMSVFVMAENYTMPLHDHPQMHGILKCLAGTLQIQSYSIDTAHEPPLDVLERLYAINPEERPVRKKYVQCRREPIVLVDSISSPALLLTPEERNMHQITALGGPVAFFDILSPPYGTTIETRPQLERKCTFFKVAEETNETSTDQAVVLLEKIPQPLTYYCDNVEYN